MIQKLSLLQRIQARKKFTQGEQKIVVFFKQNLDQLAFETVTSISRQTNVSKATVVRFIASLGYEGFSDFQQQLQDRLVHRMQSPISRLPLMKETFTPGGEDLMAQNFGHIIGSLNETLSGIDHETFTHVARVIAGCKGRVFIEGHRSSGSIAQILWIRLQYFLPQIFILGASALSVPDQLSNIGKEDVLFSVTQSRYCNATKQISGYFAHRGATVILLTDSHWMPYADTADYKLVASCEGMAMFNSCCTLLAVVETLILAVIQLCEGRTKERSDENEVLFKYFDTFAADLKSPAAPVKKHETPLPPTNHRTPKDQ